MGRQRPGLVADGRGLGTVTRRCRYFGCHLAGMTSCRCFGSKVVRRLRYVVWATPAHPEKPWAVGREIRPGCLKVVAYAESKRLADALADRLSDGDF
jgi:hypothetical protein